MIKTEIFYCFIFQLLNNTKDLTGLKTDVNAARNLTVPLFIVFTFRYDPLRDLLITLKYSSGITLSKTAFCKVHYHYQKLFTKNKDYI